MLFGLAFLVMVFLEPLLLIRDFFVIAICVSPRNFEFELPYARVDCKWRAKYPTGDADRFNLMILRYLFGRLDTVGDSQESIDSGELLIRARLIFNPGSYNEYFRHKYFIRCTSRLRRRAAAVLLPSPRRKAVDNRASSS